MSSAGGCSGSQNMRKRFPVCSFPCGTTWALPAPLLITLTALPCWTGCPCAGDAPFSAAQGIVEAQNILSWEGSTRITEFQRTSPLNECWHTQQNSPECSSWLLLWRFQWQVLAGGDACSRLLSLQGGILKTSASLVNPLGLQPIQI